MEIFVKILTENSRDGERHIAAISFLTFVGLDTEGKPTEVPMVQPESKEEQLVFGEAGVRKEARLKKRQDTNDLIKALSSSRS